MTKNQMLIPEGREVMRVTSDGTTLHYTYPNDDNSIPEGMRRVTYLEPAEPFKPTREDKNQ